MGKILLRPAGKRMIQLGETFRRWNVQTLQRFPLRESPMQITLTVNGTQHDLTVHPGELLRTALRRLRYFSVKHGDETGESGADAVLLTHTPDAPTSYRLLNSGVMLAAQANGASIVTAEGLGSGDWGLGTGDREDSTSQYPIPNP